jgi:hypothetical protein
MKCGQLADLSRFEIKNATLRNVFCCTACTFSTVSTHSFQNTQFKTVSSALLLVYYQVLQYRMIYYTPKSQYSTPAGLFRRRPCVPLPGEEHQFNSKQYLQPSTRTLLSLIVLRFTVLAWKPVIHLLQVSSGGAGVFRCLAENINSIQNSTFSPSTRT